VWYSRDLVLAVPGLGPLEAHVVASSGTVLAVATCAAVVLLLYRRITSIGRLSVWLGAGVMATIGWIIFSGLTHFNAARALSLPQGAFALSHGFFAGLGAAMLMATYDYWGYYNVCFLGGEVRNPGRNIPRALLISIGVVAALYLAMNLSILGVIPWQELDQAAKSNAHLHIASTFMQRIYGNWAGYAVTGLVMWTAFASVFSLLLGYSRVPYAAALDGNYFKVFARVHQEAHFPYVSLLALGGVAMLFCFLRLADIIAALVVIRIVIQFLVQAIGVIVLRVRQPAMERPFRMWLYPLPALLAACGFVFILFSRQNFMRELRYAAVILASGVVLYMARSWRRQEWPF
jgi:amino acid transporter